MGIKERKAREKELRREAIMKAAAEVINEQGFPATSLDLIAERAELSRGTIYFYFKTREELYGSVLLNWLQNFLNDLQKAASPKQPLEKALSRVGKIYLRYYVKYAQYFKLFAYLHQGEMEFDMTPELLAEIRMVAIQGLMIGRDIIQRGIEEGLFIEVDPWETAKIIWGAVNGITMLYGNYKDPNRDKESFIRTFETMQGFAAQALRRVRPGLPPSAE